MLHYYQWREATECQKVFRAVGILLMIFTALAKHEVILGYLNVLDDISLPATDC
ncbi:hypothetical protein BDV34DRAFT_193532 [Aspergillus parasiticus]|uniref:Uncharacterized protein n=1 Tax=Aspergillus parasiticus TaxID=5067 RepID=A0A5N6DQZ5_ASPPA|nr:hypothetical protein BDV34DRAFT_193532 [Aspergillus parasiticus]